MASIKIKVKKGSYDLETFGIKGAKCKDIAEALARLFGSVETSKETLEEEYEPLRHEAQIEVKQGD